MIQDVSVNLRRMSKEDARLNSTSNLDILNNSLYTSRRSSRLSRSNVNYCEDEPPSSSTLSKSTRNDNISLNKSRSRRNFLENTGAEEVDMDDLFILENNDENFGSCKSLTSTPGIPAARRRSAPASQRSLESVSEAESEGHVR